MRIIPVLDLLDGNVVHGVAGNRSEYKPITSKVTRSHLPVEVAGDLKRTFGFSQLYIADLNSIQGRGSHWEQIEEIRNMGYTVYLDPGIENASDLASYRGGVDRIVVGTETLGSLRELEGICRMQSHIVVSLDYRGELLARDEFLKGVPPAMLVDKICRAGAAEIIYLDIKKVGTSSGTSSKRMETVISTSQVPVLVGGGIRHSEDIEKLEELGADGVLVATCIHSGELTVRDIEKLAG